jgi:hypothetical protein
MIEYPCPKCRQTMSSPDSLLGQAETCPECGSVTVVPAPQATAAGKRSAASREKDWRRSPAHLLLLSKFRSGDSPARYRDAGCWAAALDDEPATAIDQLITERMLEPAGLPELLNYKFKIPDLKSMLRNEGLKVSGRKEDLVRRLINNDAGAMFEITKGTVLYRCTGAGVQLAESYLEGERMHREAVERLVLGLLTRGEHLEAVRAVARYEAAQVFARGVGIDWGNYDEGRDVELLGAIFNATPAILRGINDGRLRQLRPTAGMMQLWGTQSARRWLPDGFETGIRLDGDAACRMLGFHATYLRDIRECSEAGFKTVKVLGSADSCFECQRIGGKEFLLENAPELPYPTCACEMGCDCLILAAGPWP